MSAVPQSATMKRALRYFRVGYQWAGEDARERFDREHAPDVRATFVSDLQNRAAEALATEM